MLRLLMFHFVRKALEPSGTSSGPGVARKWLHVAASILVCYSCPVNCPKHHRKAGALG